MRIRGVLTIGIVGLAVGCATEVGPEVDGQSAALHGDQLDERVRELAQEHGLQPNPSLDRALTPAEQEIVEQRAELGRFLFYDWALSGVKHTSCGTCHNAAFNYADALTIARGVFCEPNEDGVMECDGPPPPPEDGGVAGSARTAPLNFRNTPSAVNSGLMPAMMVNGRFHVNDPAFDFRDGSGVNDMNEIDPSHGFQVQAPENVLFTRSLLSAQAFKPVPDHFEMRGDHPQGDHDTFQGAIAERINGIDAYHELFEEAYGPGTEIFPTDRPIDEDTDINYFDIGDAIGHFQEVDLEFTDAPWDAFLKGDDDAMSDSAKRGAAVFLGRGQCVSCHTGDLFSDFGNHNIGVPQVGPGTGQSDPDDPRYLGLDTYDFGLEEVTGDRGDRFKFRTPPLRGVALTSPYMTNGAYNELEDAIRHHVNPRKMYETYDPSQVQEEVLEAGGVKPANVVFDKKNPVEVGPGTDHHIRLSEQDIDDLVSFLVALTDPQMKDASLAPDAVPSGLPVDVAGPNHFPVYE